jgi:tetratricopeptide (TPR) repeat protein
MPSQAYIDYTELMKRRAFVDAAAFAESRSLEPGENAAFWLTQQARAHLRGGQPEKAYECGNRAVQAAPGNMYALLAKAEASMRLYRYTEALEDYAGLLNTPSVKERARRSMLECIALSTKDWSRILSLIVEWDMPREDAFRWRVKALAGLKRNEEAVAVCREWLEVSPDNPAALWELTELEIERDGLEEVSRRMGRMAKIPSRPPVYAEIYASLCKRAGNIDAALNQYSKLARSGDTHSIRKKAFALAKSGGEREATPLMEELLRLNPKDMYVHKSYIAACQRIGETERAVKFYNLLLAEHPEEISLHGRIKAIRKGKALENE